jgi:GT2 family glycosyltransferase
MPQTPYSLCASIVLYKTSVADIEPLICELSRQGVAKIYVVDNSPLSSGSSGNPLPRDAYEYIRTGVNLGYGRAHNIAIKKSVESFKYHLICNPDIDLSTNVISELVDYMDSHTDVGLCMPKLVGTDGVIQHCCRRSPVVWDYVSQLVGRSTWGKRRAFRLEMRDYDYETGMDVQCLSGCFMFFRGAVLKRLRGFDEKFFLYFEDFDLSMRSRELARNVYVPSTFVVHERQSAHRRSWLLKGAFVMSAMRYFLKWGGFGRGKTR